MNVINVMMIDNESNIEAVKQYFSSNPSMNLKMVYSCNNGIDAINYLKSSSKLIDIIVMDSILPSMDGLGVLKFMIDNHIGSKVILYSYFNNTSMIKLFCNYDVSYFVHKDISIDVLCQRILDVYNLGNIVNENNMQGVITKLLHELGMPSHIKGYQYIRDAIEYMYNKPDNYGGITKDIYPYIAKKYHTTSSRVERAIRHAIEVSWIRGDLEVMGDIFGNSVDYDRSKPTNSEFLATVTDKLLLDKINKC